MKLVFATLLLVLLVLCSSNFLQTSMATKAPVAAPTPPSFCDSKCGERCSKAKIHERCMKYCGICCQDCKCVPKGTYGNKSECPCYMNKLNSKGKPKCP